MGRCFYLWVSLFCFMVGLCCLRSIGLVFFLTVEIRFGLFAYGIGLVFSTYGFPPSGNLVWSSLLTAPPVRKLGLVFFLTVLPP